MVVYITGTGKGIGKSLANYFLSQNYFVFGLSRNNNIIHPNFSFIKIDLSNLFEIKKFRFKNHNEDVFLINNAGIIGAIKPIGEQNSAQIIELNTINQIVPQILSNQFLKQFQKSEFNFKIINISSGAAKHPIDAWATYCASKAALNLFTETLQLEFNNRNMTNWSAYSIAPGVVDTNMQEEIRNINSKWFFDKIKFIELYKNGELLKTDKVSKTIFHIITYENTNKNVHFSVRDCTFNE